MNSTNNTKSIAGRKGGTATHKCRGFECQRQGNETQAMSAQQAGKLGGFAPHVCRGRGCKK